MSVCTLRPTSCCTSHWQSLHVVSVPMHVCMYRNLTCCTQHCAYANCVCCCRFPSASPCHFGWLRTVSPPPPGFGGCWGDTGDGVASTPPLPGRLLLPTTPGQGDKVLWLHLHRDLQHRLLHCNSGQPAGVLLKPEQGAEQHTSVLHSGEESLSRRVGRVPC